MATSSTLQRLRGLVLSADELRRMTSWPNPLIDDYLNIFENLIGLARSIDIGASLDIQTISNNYTLEQNDGTVLVNAVSNEITIYMPINHIAGQEHNVKVINDDHTIWVDPNGSEIDRDPMKFQAWLDESLRIRSDGTRWWIL